MALRIRFIESLSTSIVEKTTTPFERPFDMSVKVSVIIPVYNTAPYLHECLDSVVKQTLRDIEIICENDGSTDGSLAIIWAGKN